MKGHIVYAFAGIGKTEYCKTHSNCIDLEESNFRFLDYNNVEQGKGEEKIFNKNFPQNYYDEIKKCLQKYKYVFVSYNALEFCRQNHIEYSIILPSIKNKEEYIQRYIKRNNSKNFIENLYNNFENYILKEKNDRFAEHIITLRKNEFLADGLKQLLKQSNSKISLIVPIFNCEKYLHSLFDSLTNQTYKNLEIILIDDGSTDKSLDLCKDFAMKDARVKFFHKKNGGVSSARNLGLKFATGKFVCFIDGDDLLEPNYCEDLLKTITKYKADFAYGGIKEVYGNNVNTYGNLNICGNKHDASFFINTFNNFWFPVLWNKIYKRNIIINNKIKFKKLINYNEDTVFNFEYYVNCRKIATTKNIIYDYFIRNGGLTQKGIKDVFNSSYKTIPFRLRYPKMLFGKNDQAVYISSKKILKAIIQQSNMMLKDGLKEEEIFKFFDDCLKKPLVKETIKYITVLENNYNEWFAYNKIFVQKQKDFLIQYIKK